jgi:hypothetical protein
MSVGDPQVSGQFQWSEGPQHTTGKSQGFRLEKIEFGRHTVGDKLPDKGKNELLATPGLILYGKISDRQEQPVVKRH